MKQNTISKTKNVYGKVATKQIFYNDGFGIKYHDTEVIKIVDTVITLNSGGWFSKTTKDRINQYLPEWFNLFQNKGFWYLKTPKDNYAFFDGMKIDINGLLLNPQKKVFKDIKRKENIKKSINSYCRALSKTLEAENLIHSSGDCWYCLMRTQDNKSLGDAMQKDNSHLHDHLKEKYIMYSLVFNALEYKGYRYPQLFLERQKDFKTTVIRAVRSYFTDKLINKVKA